MYSVQQPQNFTVNVNITAILPECCFDVLYCVKSCGKIDDKTALLHFGNSNHASLYNLGCEKHFLQCYNKCISTPYISFSEKNEEKIPDYLIYQTNKLPSIDLEDFSHKYNTHWEVHENNKINLNIKKIYNDLYICSHFIIPNGYKALNDVYYKLEIFDEIYDLAEIIRDDCKFNNKTIKIKNCLLKKNKITIKVLSNNDLFIALKNESVIGTVYKFNTLSCVEINKI
jgi:hypothetical protein